DARSAAAVTPLLRLCRESAAQRDTLAATVARLGATEREALADRVQRAVEQAAAVRALQPDAARLTELSTQVERLELRAHEIVRTRGELDARSRLADLET